MKLKLLFIAFAVIVFTNARAQKGFPDEAARVKICKDWKIESYEMFGTINKLDDSEKFDHIIFNKDFTCTAVEHGKEIKGTWVADAGITVITVIPPSKYRRVYRVKSISDKEMTLLYQDSILVKRTYHMSAIK